MPSQNQCSCVPCPQPATQLEAELGVESNLRSWSPERVHQAVLAELAKLPPATLPPLVTSMEAVSGTSADIRSWAPIYVAQAAHRPYISPRTNPTILESGDANIWMTNQGATAPVPVGLDHKTSGSATDVLNFMVVDPFEIVVNPTQSDHFISSLFGVTLNGMPLTSNHVGACLSIMRNLDGNWLVTRMEGFWEVGTYSRHPTGL